MPAVPPYSSMTSAKVRCSRRRSAEQPPQRLDSGTASMGRATVGDRGRARALRGTAEQVLDVDGAETSSSCSPRTGKRLWPVARAVLAQVGRACRRAASQTTSGRGTITSPTRRSPSSTARAAAGLLLGEAALLPDAAMMRASSSRLWPALELVGDLDPEHPLGDGTRRTRSKTRMTGPSTIPNPRVNGVTPARPRAAGRSRGSSGTARRAPSAVTVESRNAPVTATPSAACCGSPTRSSSGRMTVSPMARSATKPSSSEVAVMPNCADDSAKDRSESSRRPSGPDGRRRPPAPRPTGRRSETSANSAATNSRSRRSAARRAARPSDPAHGVRQAASSARLVRPRRARLAPPSAGQPSGAARRPDGVAGQQPRAWRAHVEAGVEQRGQPSPVSAPSRVSARPRPPLVDQLGSSRCQASANRSTRRRWLRSTRAAMAGSVSPAPASCR
jgi:hypothetical protein